MSVTESRPHGSLTEWEVPTQLRVLSRSQIKLTSLISCPSARPSGGRSPPPSILCVIYLNSTVSDRRTCQLQYTIFYQTYLYHHSTTVVGQIWSKPKFKTHQTTTVHKLQTFHFDSSIGIE